MHLVAQPHQQPLVSAGPPAESLSPVALSRLERRLALQLETKAQRVQQENRAPSVASAAAATQLRKSKPGVCWHLPA